MMGVPSLQPPMHAADFGAHAAPDQAAPADAEALEDSHLPAEVSRLGLPCMQACLM
jgi:hypothetical protein